MTRYIDRYPTASMTNNPPLGVDHEKHALCDSYIVEFIHDATENYYERGKYGCRNFHLTFLGHIKPH